MTQHSGNLVAVTALPLRFFFFYSTRHLEVFQTCPSKFKSLTPCLYCCSC